ncbi:MAG: hypothetical protein QHI38_10555 [Armatimonadota bacterium]|nr:hypothetical protein [Armatimonadota bacterium]
MFSKDRCPLCSEPAQCRSEMMTDWYAWRCERCGCFQARREVIEDEVMRLPLEKRMQLASCIREMNTRYGVTPVGLCYSDTDDLPAKRNAYKINQLLTEVFPRRVQDRFDRALLNLCAVSQYPGQEIPWNRAKDFPLVIAESAEVADFIVRELERESYVKANESFWSMGEASSYSSTIAVTGPGYRHAAGLVTEQERERSRRAFVAMWFAEEMNEAWEKGIKPAILECGFEPVRIDEQEFNSDIVDEIIAEIRRSKFIVADFTGQRNGVYYEAGFARGLGIPVISTVKTEQIDSLHFDTQHNSHVLWADPNELHRKLLNRIRATISTAI